ncbi:hypothetical protein QF042_001975 [Pedobacter sp. W3I1]|nr:hypothetical protein [Pedobacter sp. W3I1]
MTGKWNGLNSILVDTYKNSLSVSPCRFRINAVKVMGLICLINRALFKIKNETNNGRTELSHEVLPMRPLTDFFIEDLKRIADLKIPRNESKK